MAAANVVRTRSHRRSASDLSLSMACVRSLSRGATERDLAPALFGNLLRLELDSQRLVPALERFDNLGVIRQRNRRDGLWRHVLHPFKQQSFARLEITSKLCTFAHVQRG